MIVLLTEEPSMRECLEVLIPRLWANSIPGKDWIVLSFQGKSDLEKSIPKKMRSWNYGNPHFIILRDNDGGDCFAVKRRLRATAQRWNRPFHVRIVCQELESWLLGDFNAIKRAYPRIAGVSNRPKFRNPDDLTNPSQQLDSLVNERAKIRRAKNISQHFDLTANRSKNLNVFIATLQTEIRKRRPASSTHR